LEAGDEGLLGVMFATAAAAAVMARRAAKWWLSRGRRERDAEIEPAPMAKHLADSPGGLSLDL